MSEGFATNTPWQLPSFDTRLGQRIIELNMWALRQGLGGAATEALFGELCQRLAAADVPLARAFVGMRTMHPQLAGYTYTWQRNLGIEPEQFERGPLYENIVAGGPFGALIDRLTDAAGQRKPWACLRRPLAGPAAKIDFPILAVRAAAGATDYFAMLVRFAAGDPSRGSGIGYSFDTERAGGFSEDDLTLFQAVLPAVALAMMADAGHTIAAGLLATYLGADAGRRVHQGAVARGSLDRVDAVLWYADIRSFTALADVTPGLVVVALLDDIFESLAAPLRQRGGQVLKFLGDGILAAFPIGADGLRQSCGEALDAAVEAMDAIDRLNYARRQVGKPVAAVDLALHIGEVFYGNVGAADRLDFTVIGPAVNEASRIEALCEPLARKVLVSAEFAAAACATGRLRPLGPHRLRGVREAREIFALEMDPPYAV
jgi:adenylate cyclase